MNKLTPSALVATTLACALSVASAADPAILSDIAKVKRGDTLKLRMDIKGFIPYSDPPDAQPTPACAPDGARLSVTDASDPKRLLVVPYSNVSDKEGDCYAEAGDPNAPRAYGKIRYDKVYEIKPEALPNGTFNKSGFAHGALLVPFKRRFSDRVLSGEANVGYFIGYEFSNWRGFSWLPIYAAGLSLVNVDDNEAATTSAKRGDTGTRAAFSQAIGLVVKTFDNFQIGVVLGVDRIGGDTTWKYENKKWMSLSIGYDFTK